MPKSNSDYEKVNEILRKAMEDYFETGEYDYEKVSVQICKSFWRME